MVTVSFKNWSEVLATADLPEKERASHKVIILWYLGHLKRTGQAATVASARAFIEGVKADRRPSEWSLWSWREGLNWFFRNEPMRRRGRRAETRGRKKLGRECFTLEA